MKREYVEAVNLLSTLQRGDTVEFTADGRTSEMFVTREIHRSDGAFGSYESNRVTVSYGPGRYSREITADQMVHNQATIVRVSRNGQQLFGPDKEEAAQPPAEEQPDTLWYNLDWTVE